MKKRIKRASLLALALLNITTQLTFCSNYWQQAQKYWSQNVPSRQTVYSYMDPRQYSPSTLAGLAVLGAGGGLYYRNYLKQQQLGGFRKRLIEQARTAKKLELEYANKLLKFAENLDLEDNAKENYTNRAAQIIADLITELSPPTKQESQPTNTSVSLQNLADDLKRILYAQIQKIVELVPNNSPYKETLTFIQLNLTENFTQYSLDQITHKRNNIIKTILSGPKNILAQMTTQQPETIQNYAEYNKKLERYQDTLEGLMLLLYQPRAKYIFEQADHAVRNAIKALDTANNNLNEIVQVIQLSSEIITELYQSIDKSERSDIKEKLELSDRLLENIKKPTSKGQESEEERKPIEEEPPSEQEELALEIPAKKEEDKEAEAKEEKEVEIIEPQKKIPHKKRKKRTIEKEAIIQQTLAEPRKKEDIKKETVVTRQDIEDSIRQSIADMEKKIQELETEHNEKGEFDFSLQFAIGDAQKNLTKLQEINIKTLNKLIDKWLKKLELYQAIWNKNTQIQAQYLLDRQLRNYKEILTDTTLSKMLSFVESQRIFGKGWTLRNRKELEEVLKEKLSPLHTTTSEGFYYTLSEKDKKEITNLIIAFVNTPHRNQYSTFIQSIFDKTKSFKDIPGFKELHHYLETNKSTLSSLTVGETVEQYLKNILMALTQGSATIKIH